MNKLILGGEVIEVIEKSIIMTTTEASSDGREFTEEHDVKVGKKKDVAEIKPGNRIRVVGNLVRNDENRTIIMAEKIELYDSLEDLNIARLIGTAHRTFEFYPRAEGRAAFGNLLITVDQTIYRGVAFGHMAHVLHRGCTKASKVQLEGRLRTRTYEDRDGDKQEMLEIVADPDHTKVLKTAAIIDRFEEFEEEEKKEAAI